MSIKKQYLTLDEAANELKCDTKSIVHAVETEKIHPAVQVNKIPVLAYEIVTLENRDYLIDIGYGYFSGIAYLAPDKGLELIKEEGAILDILYPSKIGRFQKDSTSLPGSQSFRTYQEDVPEPFRRFLSKNFDKSWRLFEINNFNFALNFLCDATSLSDKQYESWWEVPGELLPLSAEEKLSWNQLQEQITQRENQDKTLVREYRDQMRILKEKIEKVLHEKIWQEVKKRSQLFSIIIRAGNSISTNKMNGLFCFRAVPNRTKLLDMIKKEKHIGTDFYGIEDRHQMRRAYSYDYSGLFVSKNDLVITREQVDEINHPSTDGENISRRYSTSLMKKMYQAIEKFWLNLDPDRLPKSKNEIIPWLVDQGISEREAIAIDLIIRPDHYKAGGIRARNKK